MHIPTYLKFWMRLPFLKNLVTGQAKSVFDIDYAQLKKTTDLVIFDVDDTLTPFKQDLPQRSLDLLSRLKQSGWSVGVYSNCSAKRSADLHALFDPLGIYSVFQSNKPQKDGFLEVCNEFKIEPAKAMMIGDKLGTDMYGAYRAGIAKRILVKPFSNVWGGKKADIFNRYVRWYEKFYYFKVFRRGK